MNNTTNDESFDEDYESKSEGRDSNPDAITGEPGSHPVGTGVGATAGGVAGAAIGSFAGPIGTLIGTAVGAIAGGYTGKGIAESIDPSEEDAFWRENHSNQAHASEGSSYDEFAPAYRVGYTGYQQDKTFDAAEEDLRMQYEGGPQMTNEEKALGMTGDASISDPASHGSFRGIPWEQGGREAARAAYHRVHERQAHSNQD